MIIINTSQTSPKLRTKIFITLVSIAVILTSKINAAEDPQYISKSGHPSLQEWLLPAQPHPQQTYRS